MARREPKTILELAIAIGGYKKGFRVVMFIEQWTIAQHALGHVPYVEEAADWWKEPHRTWWRYLSEFREIFDVLETPAPLAEAVIANAEAKREALGSVVAQLGRMVPPRAIAAA